jgi:hypothetical protein
MLNKLTKTFLVAAGAIAAIYLMTPGVRSVPRVVAAGRPGQTAAPVKKASEQFKNIQVLKDLPADKLYPEMHFMSESLGVECVDCHVGIPGQVDGEKDDKQMKLTARKMIKMTMEINKANFDGQNSNRTVTCYTCHRGSRQPLARPIISEVAAPKAQTLFPSTF